MSGGIREKGLEYEEKPYLFLTVAYLYIGEGTRIHVEWHVRHELATPAEKSHFARAVTEFVLITQSFQIDN